MLLKVLIESKVPSLHHCLLLDSKVVCSSCTTPTPSSGDCLAYEASGGGRGEPPGRGRGCGSFRDGDCGVKKCTHCGLLNHIDTCWDLLGKPAWSNQASTRDQSGLVESSSGQNTIYTPGHVRLSLKEFQKLQALLKEPIFISS